MTADPSQGPTRDGGRRLALGVLGILAAILVTAWISRVSEGRRALEACDSAVKRGDRVEAIVHARVAAAARCPGCSSSELGFDRLASIAKESERGGDDVTAVAAWRAARAATLAATFADEPRRSRIDAEVARLEHRVDLAAAAATGGAPTPAASEERLRLALSETHSPTSAVFLLLAAGGVVFAVFAIRFVRAAKPSLLEALPALLGLGVAIAGALLF